MLHGIEKLIRVDGYTVEDGIVAAHVELIEDRKLFVDVHNPFATSTQHHSCPSEAMKQAVAEINQQACQNCDVGQTRTRSMPTSERQ